LFDQLTSWENLYAAWRRAAKGKRGKIPASSFEYHLEDELLQIQKELIDQSYQPGCYRSFFIHEPKRRLISAAPFRDRVVHHALCRVIEPIFERSFISDSFANRIGKGTHRALDRAQFFSRKYRYVLQCDIEQFFAAIDHQILTEILCRKIADEKIQRLVATILRSGEGVLQEEYALRYFPGDDLFAALRPRGLPIGNLTSQFWANCYLNPFDNFIKRELQIPGYLRYVDDFLLFSNNKNELWDAKRQIIKRLESFRLKIHENKAQVRPVREGTPFLGFLIFPTHRRLKRSKGVHFVRRLKNRIQLYQQGEIEFEQVKATITGWINHVRFGDTWRLRGSILSQNPIRTAHC